MPTLVQINVTANWGSTGRIAEEIGIEAIQHGWHSIIAYGRQANPSQSELIRIGSNFDIYAHLLGTRLFDLHGLMSSRATKALVKRLKEIEPDIIHLHNIHGYYLNYPILFEYLKQTHIPIVWTLHDCWGFTGHCGHFVYKGCDRWKKQCHHCPLTKAYPKSLWMDRSKESYKLKKNLLSTFNNLHIVTVSQWLANMAQQSFLGIHPIQCIYNGIDTSIFKYKECKSQVCQRLNISPEKRILLGVSNVWTDSKGLPDYLKLRELLSNDFVIVLVGMNKKSIKSLPDGIIGIERTGNLEELVALYSSADVVLSLSSAETFGLTIAEGMACGIPSIVYNNTSQPELITNETGAVVKQGDITGLVDTIISICSRKKELFHAACRSRVANHFNKVEQYKKYLDLYQSLI